MRTHKQQTNAATYFDKFAVNLSKVINLISLKFLDISMQLVDQKI